MTSDRPAGPPLAAPLSPKNLNPAAPVFRQGGQDKAQFPSDLVSSDKDFGIGQPLTNGDVHIMAGALPLHAGAQSPAAMSMNMAPGGSLPTGAAAMMGGGQPFPMGGSPDSGQESSSGTGPAVAGMYSMMGGSGVDPVENRQASPPLDSGTEDPDTAALESSSGGGIDTAEVAGEDVIYPEEVIAPIKKQLEYYFSSENLPGDKFLNQQMDQDKFVLLSVFPDFNRMKPICSNTAQLVQAVQESSVLELNDDKTKVRISQTRKTLTLRSLPPKATDADVRRVLEENDCPKPQHVEIITLHKAVVSNWYVSFATEDECMDAFFKLHNTKVMVDGYSIGCCIKSSGTLAATGSFPSQEENQQRRMTQQSQPPTPVASVAGPGPLTQQPTPPAVAPAATQQPTALMHQPFNPIAMHPALMASAGQGLYYNQNPQYMNHLPYMTGMTGMITQTWPGTAAMEPGLMLQNSGLQPQHIRTQVPRPHMIQNATQPRYSSRPPRVRPNMDKGMLDRNHHDRPSQGSALSNSRNSPRGMDNSNPSAAAANIINSLPRRTNIRDDVTVTIGGGHQTSGQQPQHQLVSTVISQPHTVTVGPPAASTTIVNSVMDNAAASVPTPVSVAVHNQIMSQQQQHQHQQQQQHQQQVHHSLHPQPLMPSLSGSNPQQTSNQPLMTQPQHHHHHQQQPSHHQQSHPHVPHHQQLPPHLHPQQQQHHHHGQNQHPHHHHHHHNNQQSLTMANSQQTHNIPSHQPMNHTPQPHHPHHHHQQHHSHQQAMHAPSSHQQHHQAPAGHHNHHPHHQQHHGHQQQHHGMMQAAPHHQPHHPHHPHHQMMAPNHPQHHHQQAANFNNRPDAGNRRNKKRREETNVRNPRGDRQPATNRSNFSSQVPPVPDNFTMEANSFPPLPGATSAPSSDVSQENRMMHSDIVKGVTRVPSMSSSAPTPSATRATSSSSPSPIPTPTMNTSTSSHLSSVGTVAAAVVVDHRAVSNDEADSMPEDDATSSSQEEAEVEVGTVEPVATVTRQFRQDLQISSTSEPTPVPAAQTRYSKTNSSPAAPIASSPSNSAHKNGGDSRQTGSNSQMIPRSQPQTQQAATVVQQQQQHHHHHHQQQQQQQQQQQVVDQTQESNKERPSYAQILQNKRDAAASELNAAAVNAQSSSLPASGPVSNGPNNITSPGPQTHQPNNYSNSGRQNINNAFREQGNYMSSGQSSRPLSQRPPKDTSGAARTEVPSSRLPNGRRNSKENRAQSNSNNIKHDRRKPDGRSK